MCSINFFCCFHPPPPPLPQGVVSRIEPVYYAHAGHTLLGVQIDAAINPGNSGGPAFVDGRVVGVAFQNRQNASSVGYVIPVPIINHFLRDVEAGGYRTVDRSGSHLSHTGSAGASGRSQGAEEHNHTMGTALGVPATLKQQQQYGFCGIMLSCQETFNMSLQRFMGLLPKSIRIREKLSRADDGEGAVSAPVAAAAVPARRNGSGSAVGGRSAAARAHILAAASLAPVAVTAADASDAAEGVTANGDSAAAAAAAANEPGFVSVADSIGNAQHLTGVLVNTVHRTSPCFGHLRRYDVLLAVDDHPIAGDGSVHFRGYERIGFDYLISLKYSGDPCKITFLRRRSPGSAGVAGSGSGGAALPITASTPATEVEVMERTVDMRPVRHLVSGHGYDKTASYYVFGGMVFVPLSMPYLHEFGKDWYQQAPRDLVQLAVHGNVAFSSQEVVVMTQVLPDARYDSPTTRIFILTI